MTNQFTPQDNQRLMTLQIKELNKLRKEQEAQIIRISQENERLIKVNEELRNKNQILMQDNDGFQNRNSELQNRFNELYSAKILLNKEIEEKSRENEKLQNQIHTLGNYKQSENYSQQIQNPIYQAEFRNQSSYYQKNQFLKQSQHFSQIRQPTNKIEPQTQINQREQCRLFQSFYIIGSKQEEISQNNQNQIVNPTIQYQYPQNTKKLLDTFSKQQEISILGNFFPFGNKIQKLDDITDVQEIIYQGNQNLLKKKLQIFIVPTNQEEQQVEYSNEEFVRLYNPDKSLYGICITVDDFIEIDGKYIQYQKSYCFLTYFPIIDFFSIILCHFINQIKIYRNEQQFEKQTISDGFTIIENFVQTFENNLNRINAFPIQRDNSTIEISLINSTQFTIISHRIQSQEEITKTMIKWSAQIVFQLFKAEQIQQIYFCLLLEQKILFISENQQDLSATILFFLDLLAPMKWAHKLIFSINKSIVNEITNTENDCYLIGVNQNSKYVTKQIIQKSDEIILIHIDKSEDKIQFNNSEQQAKLINIIPEIKELEKFRKTFAQNWEEHRFLVNSESCVLQTIQFFKKGMDDFIFAKIRPEIAISVRIYTIQNGFYNDHLLYNSVDLQFEVRNRIFLRYFLGTKMFQLYIQSNYV